MDAMLMHHALMTMALTFVFAMMDLQEMDSIVQVTNQISYSFLLNHQRVSMPGAI